MHQKESWLTKILELPQPLTTWLQKSYLIQTPDFSCVLFVDNYSEVLLKNLTYLSQIYPLAKSLYPTITSLHVASTTLQEFIKTGKIEIYSIEVNL